MRKKRQKLGGKFWVALGLVIAMLTAVVMISYKDGKKAESLQKKASERIEKAVQDQQQDNKKSSEDVNTQNQTTYIKIANEKEFIQPVLGSRTYEMNQKLLEYMQDKEIKADKATCLDCNIPLDNPDVTEFFLELGDKKSTLITITYKPKDGEILIEDCEYTRKEIDNAVWMLKNGPAVKGVED